MCQDDVIRKVESELWRVKCVKPERNAAWTSVVGLQRPGTNWLDAHAAFCGTFHSSGLHFPPFSSHHLGLWWGTPEYSSDEYFLQGKKERILMPWKLNLLWICPQCLYQSTTGVFKMALQHSKFPVAYMRYFSWGISEMSAFSSATTSFSANSSTEMRYVCHQALWVLRCHFKGYQDTRIQGYLFANDIKMCTGICLGDVPIFQKTNSTEQLQV